MFRRRRSDRPVPDELHVSVIAIDVDDDDRSAADTVRPWAEAGATWWIDADWSSMDRDVVREASERRLKAGPPRID